MNFISAKELQEIYKNPDILIVDIRESYERNICTIPSIHIPMSDIRDNDLKIPSDKKIILLCRSGRRAEVVANYLETERGYNNLFVLEGGILAWIEFIDNTLEIY